MQLTKETVQQIANLARLELTDEQITMYQEQLSAILGYAERLNELDLEGVPETTHAVPSQNVWRADQVEAILPREQALANAAQRSQGQFVIQAILEE